MTDFVFSQLEDISNDTFSGFSPYSPYPVEHCDWSTSTASNSYGGGSNLFEGYESPQYTYDYGGGDEYMTDDIYYPSPYGDNYSQPQQPYASMQETFTSSSLQVPSEIKLRDIILQDHNGQQLEHRRIADIKLKLFQTFFGLEYNDSFVGKAVSQFFPSDIITVVRQCDRVGIFIQFRRFLTCRKYNETLYSGGDQTSDSEHTYFRDSPFVQCMYMMLEFVDMNHISTVFQYLVSNERISTNLKMVYDQWMFCAEMCTDSDVHIISLSLAKGSSGKQMQNAYNVNNAAVMERPTQEDEETDETSEIDDLANTLTTTCRVTGTSDMFNVSLSTTPTRTPTKIPAVSTSVENERKIGWAKAAQDNQMKPKSERSVVSTRKKSVSNTSIIAPDKLEQVLPPAFKTISEDIRNFAMVLLKEGRLLPFQISVGLCETLAIAETPQAKIRAKSVLFKLSSQPTPVQLGNVHILARYILGQKSNLPPPPKMLSQQQNKSPSTSDVSSSNSSSSKKSNLPPVPPNLNQHRKSHPDILHPPKNVEYGGAISPQKTRHDSLSLGSTDKRSKESCIIS